MGGSNASSTDDAGSQKSATNEEIDERNGFENGFNPWEAIYRTVFLICQWRPTFNKKFVVAAILLEYIQLVAIVLRTASLGWDIDYEQDFWKWVFRIELGTAMQDAGYTAFIVVFGVLCGLLLLAWAIIIRVGYVSKGGLHAFNHSTWDRWLLYALRVIITVFFSVFYISILSVLLTPIGCVKGAGGVLYLQSFPHELCSTKMNLSLILIGCAACLLLFVTVLGSVMATTTSDACSPDPFASIASSALGRLVFFKTALVLLAHALISQNVLLEVALLLCMLGLLFTMMRYVPYYSRRMNSLWNGLYMSITWMMLNGFVLSLMKEERTHLLTIIMLAGWAPMALIGYWLMTRRIAHTVRIAHKFLNHEVQTPPDDESQDLHVFKNAHEVEICARIVSDKMVCKVRQMQPNNVHQDAAWLLYLTGLEQHPKSAYLHVCFSHFLWRFASDTETGRALSNLHLERARNAGLGWIVGYQVAMRDLEQQNNARVLETSMDMAAYIEFMSYFKNVLAAHKKALVSVRDFWRKLMSDRVTFLGTTESIEEIYAEIAAAERAYKALLNRYPRSAKLLRSYATFLEQCKNDPLRSHRYNMEADKVDQVAEEAETRREAGAAGRVDDEQDGVIVIGSTGLVTMANKVVLRMFGYRREELMNKNVRMLMGPPYTQEHDGYLRRYMATNVAHVVGSYRDFDAKHKLGHQVPIRLYVNKVERTGEVRFMGIIRSRKDMDANIVVSEAGFVSSLNKPFQEMFGFTLQELQGRLLSLLVHERQFGGKTLPEYLKFVSEPAAATGLVPKLRLEATHKNHMLFPVSATFERVATGSSVSYRATVVGLNNQLGMITISNKGQVLTANKFVCELFGYKEPLMLKKNVSELMPLPYSFFHEQYLTRYNKRGPQGRLVGTHLGRSVVGLHADGSTFCINLTVQEIRDDKGARSFTAKISPVDSAGALNIQRVMLQLDGSGVNIQSAGANAEDLLGIPRTQLIGMSINDLLDLSRCNGGAGARSLADLLFQAERKGQHASWRLPVLRQARGGTAASNGSGRNTNGTVGVVQLERALGDGEDIIRCQVWTLAAVEGVVGIAEDGTVVVVNDAMEAFFGYPQTALVGSSVSKLFTPRCGALWQRKAEPPLIPDMEDSNYEASADPTKAGINTAMVAKLLGARRRMDCLHRDGTVFSIELEMVEVPAGSKGDGRGAYNGAKYVARCLCLPQSDRDLAPEDVAVNTESINVRTSEQGDGTGSLDGSKKNDALVDVGDGEEEEDGEEDKEDEERDGMVGQGKQREGKEEEIEAVCDAGLAKDASKALPKTGAPKRRGVRFSQEKDDSEASGVREAATLPTSDSPTGDGAGNDDSDETNDNGGQETKNKKKKPLSLAMERFLGDQIAGVTKGDAPADGNAATPANSPGGVPQGTGAEGGRRPDKDGSQQGSASEDGTHSSASSSMTDGEGGTLAGAVRFKRFRSIRGLLEAPATSKCARRLVLWFKVVMLLVVALAAGLLVQERLLIMDRHEKTVLVKNAAQGAHDALKIAQYSRVLDMAGRPGGTPVQDVPRTEALVCKYASEMLYKIQEVFIGPDGKTRKPAAQVYKLFTDKNMVIRRFIDIRPTNDLVEMWSLWDTATRYARSARKICYPHNHTTADKPDRDERNWRFVMYNGHLKLAPSFIVLAQLEAQVVRDTHEKLTIIMAVLFLGQVVVLVPLAAAVLFYLVVKAGHERVILYNVFLLIPRPILRQLARQPIEIEIDQDGDDDDDDAEDALIDSNANDVNGDKHEGPKGGVCLTGTNGDARSMRAKAGGMKTPGISNTSHAGDKTGTAAPTQINFSLRKSRHGMQGMSLDSRKSRPLVYFVPLVLIAVLMGAYFGATMLWQRQDEPLIGNIMATGDVLYRVSNVAFLAQELVLGADHIYSRADLQQQLDAAVVSLQEHYLVMTRGNRSAGDGPEGIIFFATETTRLLFGKQLCIHLQINMGEFSDTTPCLNETHPWYPIQSRGLDSQVWSLIDKADRLGEAAGLSSIVDPLLQYVLFFADSDIAAGMTGLNLMFEDIISRNYRHRLQAQIILMVALLLAIAWCWFRLIKRHITHRLTEPERIAEMLSLLPVGIKAETLVRQAYRYDPKMQKQDADKNKKASKEEADKQPKVSARMRLHGMLNSAKDRFHLLADNDFRSPQQSIEIGTPGQQSLDIRVPGRQAIEVATPPCGATPTSRLAV